MSIYVIGIDPGINGGIVALNNGKVADISPMPSDPRALKEHFLFLGFPNICHREEVHIFIENVHSMPTDGVHSAFRFGQGLGWLEGVIATLSSVEPLKVNSMDWMKYYDLKRYKGVLDGGNTGESEKKYDYKKRVKETALKLVGNDHKLKITLKTCDAYLIALYGYRTLK